MFSFLFKICLVERFFSIFDVLPIIAFSNPLLDGQIFVMAPKMCFSFSTSDVNLDNTDAGMSKNNHERHIFSYCKSFSCRFSEGFSYFFLTEFTKATILFKSSIFCPSHLVIPYFFPPLFICLYLQLSFHILTYFIRQETLKLLLLLHLLWRR